MIIKPPSLRKITQQRNWNLLILKGAIGNLGRLVWILPVVQGQKELLALLSRAECLLRLSIDASYQAQKNRIVIAKTGDSQLT